MAKFNCICGSIIRTSGAIPNPDEWLVISDVEYESLGSEATLDQVYPKFRSFFICDNCKRLWFFWEGFGKEPTPYKIDD